jgi:hypothetical protein
MRFILTVFIYALLLTSCGEEQDIDDANFIGINADQANYQEADKSISGEDNNIATHPNIETTRPERPITTNDAYSF